jgi:hypothetical protein
VLASVVLGEVEELEESPSIVEDGLDGPEVDPSAVELEPLASASLAADAFEDPETVASGTAASASRGATDGSVGSVAASSELKICRPHAMSSDADATRVAKTIGCFMAMRLPSGVHLPE